MFIPEVETLKSHVTFTPSLEKVIKKLPGISRCISFKKMVDVPVSDGFSGVQLVLEPSKSHEHACQIGSFPPRKLGMKNDKGLKHQQLSKS